MSKRAIKLVKTARKNIIKKRKMSFITPPQSPDNRSDSQKIKAHDKRSMEKRRSEKKASQNDPINNNAHRLNFNDNANYQPDQFVKKIVYE